MYFKDKVKLKILKIYSLMGLKIADVMNDVFFFFFTSNTINELKLAS